MEVLNKKYKTLSIYTLIVAINSFAILLLLKRYSLPVFNIDRSQLMFFGIISYLNVFLLIFSFTVFKKYINPLSLFCLFIFFYAYSILPLTENYRNINFNTHLVVIITLIAFITGLLLPFSKLNIKLKIGKIGKIQDFFSFFQKDNNKVIFLNGLFFLSIIVFIIEVIKIGYLPLLGMFDNFAYRDAIKAQIHFLHYFVVLTALIPSWAYIFHKEGKISKRYYIIIQLVSIFILINFFSRQIILIYLITNFYTYNYYSGLSVKKGILVVIFILSIFFTIGYLRVLQDYSFKPKSAENYQNEYFNRASKSKYNLSTIESFTTLYASARFYALDKFVHQKDSLNYYGYGMYTLKPVISLFFLNRVGFIDYESKFDIPDILPTFVIDAYLDFGYAGSIILNILYGLFVSVSFLSYFKKEKRSIICLSIALFCIIMMPFMNYFNSFFVWLIIGINRLLIK
jgi:hypothetical protein